MDNFTRFLIIMFIASLPLLYDLLREEGIIKR